MKNGNSEPPQNTAIIQRRHNGGLNQESDDGQLDSSQVLKTEPTIFVDELDVKREQESRRAVKGLRRVELA